MKFNNSIFSTCAVAVVMAVAVPQVAAQPKTKQVELFGITLKNADREQLRQAFKQNGMKAVREDKLYWVDTYNAEGVLEGASEFSAGYVSATGKFAFAEYKFAGFMDTQLVGKVISMVSVKYGRPSAQSGDYGLGPVTATWNIGQDMKIEVSRSWPDTTALLKFIDSAANKQMRVEIDAEMKTQERQKAKSQNKAF
jgi:hypothetical protein